MRFAGCEIHLQGFLGANIQEAGGCTTYKSSWIVCCYGQQLSVAFQSFTIIGRRFEWYERIN